MLLFIDLFISIAISIIFYNIVSKKIKQEQEFSGAAWGLICGVFSAVIPTIIAYNAVSHLVKLMQELDKKDIHHGPIGSDDDKLEPYAIYAGRQLKDFLIFFLVSTAVWIVFLIIVYINTRI